MNSYSDFFVVCMSYFKKLKLTDNNMVAYINFLAFATSPCFEMILRISVLNNVTIM